MVLWIALASVFSVLLGYSRVPYSAALDGNFLSVFAKVHPTKHFPHVSLLVLGALAFLLSVTLDLQTTIAGILAVRLIVQFIGRPWIDDVAAPVGAGNNFVQMWLYPVPAVLTSLDGRGFLARRDRLGSGIAGDGMGRAGVFDLGEEKKQWRFEGESHQSSVSAISKKERVVSHHCQSSVKRTFERRGRQK